MATQTKPVNKNATGTTDVNVSTLIPYAGNSKLHPDWHIEQIAASIHRFGFVAPIVVDEDNMILAGHGRAMAAKKLGIEMVPIVVKTGLSKAEKQAYIIADNRLTTVTDFDEETLAAELKCIMESGEFDDLELIGFTDDELEELLGSENEDGDKKDVTPPLEADVFTKTGDIYRIGPHFLVCGDSTEEAPLKVVDALGKADMVFTDPPYGMSYGGGRGKNNFKMIKNDNLQGSDLYNLLVNSLKTLKSLTKEEAALYVCFPWRTYNEFSLAITNSGYTIDSCIVWDKKSIGLGQQHYRPQHEFIAYSKGGLFFGSKGESDVWSLKRDPSNTYVHPTQKPIELIEKALHCSSKKDDVVIDLFGGSGSTMVACQHTGRINGSVELDPAYCDVIVRRMANLYPHLAITRNGEPFTPPAGKSSEAKD